VSTFAAPCEANGRFPRAQTIVSTPGGRVVYLRTTFGIMRTEDGGKSYTWMCEDAMGFSGSWDPPLAVVPRKPSGTRLFVGLQDGIAWSDDDCSFEASKSAKGYTFWDLTVHEASSTAFAVSSGKAQFTYV